MVIVLFLLSTNLIAMMENEFKTGIREVDNHKIADSNEVYDFIVPIDLDAYDKAKRRIEALRNEYEKARKRFHKKNLKPSEDLDREMALLKITIEDLKRLADLTPNFGHSMTAPQDRQKRQVIPIIASLGSFLLGSILNLGDSGEMDDIERKFKISSAKNLDFQEAQIRVTN